MEKKNYIAIVHGDYNHALYINKELIHQDNEAISAQKLVEFMQEKGIETLNVNTEIEFFEVDESWIDEKRNGEWPEKFSGVKTY